MEADHDGKLRRSERTELAEVVAATCSRCKNHAIKKDTDDDEHVVAMKYCNTSLHIKVLYLLVTSLAVCVIISFLVNQRATLELERRMIEHISPLPSYFSSHFSSGSFGSQKRGERELSSTERASIQALDDDENVPREWSPEDVRDYKDRFYQVPSRGEGTLGRDIAADDNDDDYATTPSIYNVNEKLAPDDTDEGDVVKRVKRRADGKKERLRVGGARRNNRNMKEASYNGGEEGKMEAGREGSGEEDSSMEKGIWMNTYSQLPVEELREFCAKMTENCPAGQTGSSGLPGLPGNPGPPGLPGPEGPAGKPGLPGEQGIPGDRGSDGINGLPGSPGETGLTGLPGLPGLNCTEKMPVTVAQGPPGPPGPPGSSGFNGIDGSPGLPGLPGQDGLQGMNGVDGLPGLPGEKGDRGEPGHPGPIGEKGKRGKIGLPGENGNTGPKGDRGEIGPQGREGYQGEKGDEGPAGPKGEPGESAPLRLTESGHPILGQRVGVQRGMPGPPGLPGIKGDKGNPGYVCGCIETPPPTEPTTVITTTPEPIIDPRTEDCRIEKVGKPLFQKYTYTYWGSWMKDPIPDPSLEGKYWLTKHFSGKLLYGYDNLDKFKNNESGSVYELNEFYIGTGHVVYNGSFVYQRAGFNEIIQYDLVNNETVGRTVLPHAAFQGKNYVYSTEYNYFDFAIDENGLWVIYAAELEPEFLLVSKLTGDGRGDGSGIRIEKTWNISVSHQEYGNGFIVCGILYLVQNATAQSTTIEFAYDLYEKRRVEDVRLKFNNPFHMNVMMAYNPQDRKIYSWDKGNQLVYPLLTRPFSHPSPTSTATAVSLESSNWTVTDQESFQSTATAKYFSNDSNP